MPAPESGETKTLSPRATRADSGGTTSLPPELLAEASRRLGSAALIYAATYTLAYFGPHTILTLTMAGHPFARAEDALAIAAIGLSLAVFALSRWASIPPHRLLDFGLAFNVVGALGISFAEFWLSPPMIDVTANAYVGLPWECVWIIIFPLVAPNTPRKILLSSIAAASTGPVVLWWSGGLDGPSGSVVLLFFAFSTYLCAVLAYVIARMVYRYGVRLKKAREIGSYELVRKLGEGGMGEVWVGRHRMLARPAAIKLIRPELVGSTPQQCATAVKRFEREAQATAALRSTHTIHVYDFGTAEDGSFFYVMEFLEGLTLDALVRQFGPVNASRAIHLVTQACHSLSEAHAHGLIHRDIKPANIFSSRLGPDCDFVKVLDFGLVKHASDGAESTMLTAEGVAAGTPAFMAPEIALGQPDIDGRVDIYSLGCVTYWLLTGQPVFAAPTPVATALAHVQQQPERPSRIAELPVPAALDDVILACLAKNPADRPQSANELSQQLRAIDVPRWTAEDASKWWALHGPLGALTAATMAPESPAAVVYARRS